MKDRRVALLLELQRLVHLKWHQTCKDGKTSWRSELDLDYEICVDLSTDLPKLPHTAVNGSGVLDLEQTGRAIFSQAPHITGHMATE